MVTSAAIPDPQNLALGASVNGKVRQSSRTNDMICSMRKIIAHLSQGTTLSQGTVIMTGTPSGVGHFMKPTGYLHDAGVVSLDIGGIGKIENHIRFGYGGHFEGNSRMANAI